MLSLVMTPLIVLIVRLVSVRLRKSSRAVQGAMGDVTQVIQETIEGNKVVKLYGGQAYESARFEAEANRVRRFQMKQAAAAAAMRATTSCTNYVCDATKGIRSGGRVHFPATACKCSASTRSMAISSTSAAIMGRMPA